MASLYSLSKDELVLLVSKIQERTKLETEQKCRQELLELLEAHTKRPMNQVFIKQKCQVCDYARYIDEVTGKMYHTDTERPLIQCSICFRRYCALHLEENWHPKANRELLPDFICFNHNLG